MTQNKENVNEINIQGRKLIKADELKRVCYQCGKLAMAVRKKKTFFGKTRYYNVCPKHSSCTDIPIIPNPYLEINIKNEQSTKQRRGKKK